MERPANYLEYNRQAWDHQVALGNRWTLPVSDELIEKARKGEWEIVLTPVIPVPASWFPAKGSRILALASGGGQQTPILAAAGYDVTVFDNSEGQLQRDIEVCAKHHLEIKAVQGDMADLSAFADETFDAVINPCSTGFVSDVKPVYREVARVLKKGGIFMTGFVKPVYFLFDVKLVEQGEFRLKYSMPYSDLTSLSDEELSMFVDKNEPVVYAHSLEDHFNGQLRAGMMITEIFEDKYGDDNPVDKYFNSLMAIRSVKK